MNRRKYKLKCIYCGDEFESTHKEARFCSLHCAGKYRYAGNVDKNIFGEWDSKNAYVFGLIMSDGCLTHNKDRNMIVINLNDRDILDKIHKYVYCNRNIYDNKNDKNYSLYYWNEDAVSYLRNYGLIENKSLIAEYPEEIPIKFQPDFIRGYFDGNGSIIYHETSYNTYPQVSITTGSLDFARGLVNMLSLLGIESHFYNDGREGKNAYYVRIIKINEVKKFKNMIYNGETEFVLKRKYDKFKKIDLINRIYS